MGIYPVTPGNTQYTIGSPLFDEVTIQVDEDRSFKFIAVNNSQQNKYIQSASLNGEEINRSWIDHSEIMNGGTLKFVMGAEPNKSWANSPESVPYSMTK